MIAEYALEPEMVATWGDLPNYRYFMRDFGCGQGRLVSRYPKKWAKQVWESFTCDNEMDRKRLEELLARLKENMVKRKDPIWDEKLNWLENADREHARHPFSAILAHNNPYARPEIICEARLDETPCPGWDRPHGITIPRKPQDMAAAVQHMLACCRWVKFIDPYLSPRKYDYQRSLQAFFSILAGDRPVGPLESIEIHTNSSSGTASFLQSYYQSLIPNGLQISLYQWQGRPGGQRLHNRYILTDLGGVSFHHGLDAGADDETDDLTRLDQDQYLVHCKQYDPATTVFDHADAPLTITGMA